MGARLYVDGSCDPHSGIGYGAALFLEQGPEDLPLERLEEQIVVRRFESCRSSSLELKVFLWALERWGNASARLEVHSDSQTIIALPDRRADLQQNGFCSKRGRALSQGELYRDFFDAMDRYDPKLVKRAGHKPRGEKSLEDLRFALVDRAARRALRDARG